MPEPFKRPEAGDRIRVDDMSDPHTPETYYTVYDATPAFDTTLIKFVEHRFWCLVPTLEDLEHEPEEFIP